MPSIQAAPAQTYPVGETVGAAGAFKARTVVTGSASIPADQHTDPTATVKISIDFQREDDSWWQDAVGVTVNGSPDGWPLKLGGRTTVIEFAGGWPDGIVLKGGRIRVIVSGRPVALGAIMLTWN
jgi:hypothetical protein